VLLCTQLDIFISRRCYTEKRADVTQKNLRNIWENASVLHLREKCPVVWLLWQYGFLMKQQKQRFDVKK
jgi:hypothetical protein